MLKFCRQIFRFYVEEILRQFLKN